VLQQSPETAVHNRKHNMVNITIVTCC